MDKRPSLSVREFRNKIEQLLRVANVDYQACADTKELDGWKTIAERLTNEIQQIDCKRANESDRRWHRLSIESARRQIEKAAMKIAQEEIFARKVAIAKITAADGVPLKSTTN